MHAMFPARSWDMKLGPFLRGFSLLNSASPPGPSLPNFTSPFRHDPCLPQDWFRHQLLRETPPNFQSRCRGPFLGPSQKHPSLGLHVLLLSLWSFFFSLLSLFIYKLCKELPPWLWGSTCGLLFLNTLTRRAPFHLSLTHHLNDNDP